MLSVAGSHGQDYHPDLSAPIHATTGFTTAMAKGTGHGEFFHLTSLPEPDRSFLQQAPARAKSYLGHFRMTAYGRKAAAPPEKAVPEMNCGCKCVLTPSSPEGIATTS
jgi:hypothetical protein